MIKKALHLQNTLFPFWKDTEIFVINYMAHKNYKGLQWAWDLPIPAEWCLFSVLLAPGICHCFPCHGPSPREKGEGTLPNLCTGVFTCVLTMVKPTVLWDDKYESESLPYIPVSNFPPFTFFKTSGNPHWRHHADQTLQTNTMHTEDRTMPMSTFGSFRGWCFICVWLLNCLFFRAGIVLNFCAMSIVGHLTKI